MRLFDDIVEIFQLKDLYEQTQGVDAIYFSQEKVDIRNCLAVALATARRYACDKVSDRVAAGTMSQRQAETLLQTIWS